MIPINILKKGKRFQFKNPLKITNGICDACGNKVKFTFKNAITDSLAKTWGLNESERSNFNNRESLVCAHCSNSLRTRVMAKTIVRLYSHKATSLSELITESDFRDLQIAEINSCGNLHQFFGLLPNIHYSEYGSKDSSISHEDIENLSYKDEMFDLVLTSETLEHVVDLDKALNEIYRVLKPGGKHIFTIPVILNRVTRERIVKKKNRIEQLLPESYHGEDNIGFLVAREFGGDIIDKIKEHNFKIEVYYMYPLLDTHSYIMVATKQERTYR